MCGTEGYGKRRGRAPQNGLEFVKIPALTALSWVLVAHVALAQETALPALREAAKQAPIDVAAQTALGRALIEAGRLPEADAQMAVVVRLSKGSIESLYEAARVKFASGDYKKSRAACNELAKKDKNHVLTHTCMARAWIVWRRASRAFDSLDQALRADPNNYEALLAQADAKRIQGEFAAAQQAYEALIKTAPTSADAYLGLGLVHAVANAPDKALAALRKANELNANDPDIQYELGRRSTGADAVALLKRAVAGRPHWPEAELELALAQLHAGDAANAEAGLKAYLKLTPNSPIAIANHGAALVALGRYAEAEPELRKALEQIPNDYDTSFALAQLYEHTDRYEEAFTQYRNAADLKRESPAPLLAGARLGLKLGRPVLATALLDKALERTPRSGEALALYAEALAQRGDAKAARDFYQRALAADGPIDRAAVQKRLGELK
jgi:tetratricopeptide (TPR) repeat protein